MKTKQIEILSENGDKIKKEKISLENFVEVQSNQIHDLEKNNETLDSIAKKLNTELSANRLKHKKEILELTKSHKIEIKHWKKKLCQERKLKIKVEKKFEDATSQDHNTAAHTTTISVSCQTDSSTLNTTFSSSQLVPSNQSSEPRTSSVSSSSTCLHIPQCKMRNPNPPPPFAPITFEQLYYPPKPPAKIKILPSQRLSYTQFCHLEQVSHKCEECEEGMLFHTYSERVEYDDPGPCGGVSATYLRACPNSPNAQISFSSHCEVDQKSYRFKKLCVKYDVCGKIFDKLGHLSFHMNRKHAGKE